MMLSVAVVEGGGLDALVEQVERVLLAVADRAEDLMTPAGHGQARLSGVGLGDGDLALGWLALSRLPRREIEETARGVHVAHEIGARVLDRLVAADRSPALHAGPGVLDDQIEDALGAAPHLGGSRRR